MLAIRTLIMTTISKTVVSDCGLEPLLTRQTVSFGKSDHLLGSQVR